VTAASDTAGLSERRFRELVAEALDDLPAEFGELLDNVVVVVEDEPTAEELRELGMSPDEGDELLGLYQGTCTNSGITSALAWTTCRSERARGRAMTALRLLRDARRT